MIDAAVIKHDRFGIDRLLVNQPVWRGRQIVDLVVELLPVETEKYESELSRVLQRLPDKNRCLN